jgi:hypothetical protein
MSNASAIIYNRRYYRSLSEIIIEKEQLDEK